MNPDATTVKPEENLFVRFWNFSGVVDNVIYGKGVQHIRDGYPSALSGKSEEKGT